MKANIKLPILSLDRLSFTFQVNKLSNKRVVGQHIKTLMERTNNTTGTWKNVKHVKFLGDKVKVKVKVKGRYKYHQNYQIEFESKGSAQVIFVSIFPIDGKNNFLRVELNPSHYDQTEYEMLRQLFVFLFGKRFTDRMYQESMVTKIDWALDLFDQEMYFLMTYPRVTTSSMRYESGKLLEQTVGYSRSRIGVKAYDKREERLQNGERLDKNTQWTRIEVRQRDLGIPIADLGKLPNPFKKLTIYPWNLPESVRQ